MLTLKSDGIENQNMQTKNCISIADLSNAAFSDMYEATAAIVGWSATSVPGKRKPNCAESSFRKDIALRESMPASVRSSSSANGLCSTKFPEI